MDRRPLTDGEKIAVRLGQKKAKDNERRRHIIDHYTGNKAPEAPEPKRH